MFFIMGISSSEKKLDYVQTILCSQCGQYGRYELFMTYTYLSLFFLPIFKWNKRFYVKTSCCNTVYSIDNELGVKIIRGEQIVILEQDLHIVNDGYHNNNQKRCSHCGFLVEPDYDYCPKCGNKL